MKRQPCTYCGTLYHSPYEDGLVECVQNLVEQRDGAAETERAAIVAWLLEVFETGPPYDLADVLADAIERGEHLK